MGLLMDRFVSNTVNRVDKKGRVSIPAAFRAVLGGQSVLHTILSVEQPIAEAGGSQFLESQLKRLEEMDPLSEEYKTWSFYLIGDAEELKIDTEGRITLSENIRQHTGISDQVAFVGLGPYFQLWEPERFKAYREEARAAIRQMRQSLGSSNRISPNSPERQAQGFPSGSGKGQT